MWIFEASPVVAGGIELGKVVPDKVLVFASGERLPFQAQHRRIKWKTPTTKKRKEMS